MRKILADSNKQTLGAGIAIFSVKWDNATGKKKVIRITGEIAEKEYSYV
jgi:hypothetical protein